MEIKLKDALGSFSAVKVWEHNGLSVSLGNGHYGSDEKMATVTLDALNLCIVGGPRFRDMIDVLRIKKLPDEAAYAGCLELVMTTLILEMGWVAFISEVTTQLNTAHEGGFREGDKQARTNLRRWLEGRDL